MGGMENYGKQQATKASIGAESDKCKMTNKSHREREREYMFSNKNKTLKFSL